MNELHSRTTKAGILLGPSIPESLSLSPEAKIIDLSLSPEEISAQKHIEESIVETL